MAKLHSEYARRRAEIYSSLGPVFTWDWMYDAEYALGAIHLINKEFRNDLATATTLLGKVFAKTVPVLQSASSELLLGLGIPEGCIDAARVPILSDSPTLIGRFDFANTQTGLKMLEFNSDTPTGIVEAYYVNQIVCDYYAVENPNHAMAGHFTTAFQELINSYKQFGFNTEHIWFSALDWHEEDRGTTLYLLAQSGLKANYIPLSELRILHDSLYGLVEGKHVPVDILYRLYPLEKLPEDHDEEDLYPTGTHLLDLVARKKLGLINPPEAFLLQTKALQALIWNLHENDTFFTPEEHETIEKYMLPTYLANRFLGRSSYISKPIFGREGGAVTIFNSQGDPIHSDTAENYWEQPMIYQKYAELESINIETLAGPYRGKLLWGSFLISGKASAIIARVGGPITGNLSYYLPVGIKE